MRWILIVLTVLALLVAIVFVGGMLLPVHHVAAVRARLPASPDSIYRVIEDVRSGATWRSDIDSVRILSRDAAPLRWEESGRYGVIRYVRDEARSPTHLVHRIDGTEQGFGGSWTWRLDALPAGTMVTITEEGEVYSPLFRFFSRFVFGHHGTMEGQLRDLGRHFGAEVETERLEG